jgi:hypothetical protein
MLELDILMMKTRDAFIPKKPFNSWILNEDYLSDGKHLLHYPNDGQITNIVGTNKIKVGH